MSMELERCKKLVADISVLSQVEVEEIFKIVHDSKCDYTKNNNGIFVNLAWLPNDILERLERYVRFCNESKKELIRYESLCDVLNHKMHENDLCNLEATDKASAPSATKAGDVKAEHASKISSSLRYYLLKKRYSKQGTVGNTSINYLSKDCFIMM